MLLAVALLAACTPEPAPTPTPTGFASEAEAFAAAEATYRAYIDALNAVDFGEPATFEAVYAWTAGSLNNADREDFSRNHAEEQTLEGAFEVASVSPRSWDAEDSSVELDACLDVSDVDVLDASGKSIVPSDRPDVLALRVSLVPGSSNTGLLLSDTSAREDGATC